MKIDIVSVVLSVIYGLHCASCDRTRRQAPACTEPEMIGPDDSQQAQGQFAISMECSVTDLPLNRLQNFYCKFFWIKLEEEADEISDESSDESEEAEWDYEGRRVELDAVHFKADRLINEDQQKVELKCDLWLLVSTLTVGSYRFEYEYQAEDGAFLSPNTIKLSLPEVEITDCPKGESVKNDSIKENTTATCSCRLKSSGNPPAGPADWLDRRGTIATSSRSDSGKVAILDVPFQGPGKKEQYVCHAKFPDQPDFQDRKTYIPSFAYGPQAIRLASPSSQVVTLCPSNPNKDHMKIVCDIDKETYHPEVDVAVQGFGPDTIEVLEGTDIRNNYKRHTFSLSPAGGVYNLSCTAKNALFPDMQARDSLQVQVYKPPSLAPFLSMNDGPALTNGQTVNWTLGDNVTVTCNVYGGFPHVTKTSLEIKGKKEWRSGSAFVTNVTVTRNMNDTRVKCSAQHDTNCYHLETAVTIHLLIGAEISLIFINGKPAEDDQKTVVDAGTNLTIKCFVVGKPMPSAMIVDDKGAELPVKSVELYNNKMITFKKLASCPNAGKYRCCADNVVANSVRDIWVLVLCALELNQVGKNRRQFDSAEGQNLTIHIKVRGYPRPSQHNLDKITPTDRLIVKSVHTEELQDYASKYSLVTDKVDETSWHLSLTFYQVKVADTGRYQLDVGNGIGRDLNYTFAITVTEGQKDGPNPWPIIGAVIGAVLVIIIIIIIIVFVRRYIGSAKVPIRRRAINGQLDQDRVRSESVDYDNDVYGMKPVNDAGNGEVRSESVNYDNDVYGMKPVNDARIGEDTMISNSVYRMNEDLGGDTQDTMTPNSVYGMKIALDDDIQVLQSVTHPRLRSVRESDCDYAEINDVADDDNRTDNKPTVRPTHTVLEEETDNTYSNV